MIKKLSVLGLFLLFSLLCLYSVFAVDDYVLTLSRPVTSDVVSGTEYNLSVMTNQTNYNITYAWFSAYSPSTGNSSYTSIGIVNASDPVNNSLHLDINWDSTLFDDSKDYTIRVVVNNGTWNGTYFVNNLVGQTVQPNLTAPDTSTSVRIDNSIPGKATSLSPADKSIDTDGDVTFSANVSSKSLTKCYLNFKGRFPTTSSQMILSEDGDTCSLSVTQVPEQTYEWYVTSTDGTNSSVLSDIYTLYVDKLTGISRAAAFDKALREGKIKPVEQGFFAVVEKPTLSITNLTETKYLGMPVLGWIIILIAGSIFIYYFFKKK